MANLRILGGLWLENEQTSSTGRGGQRRRLALLALLWLSPQRRVTRDKVLAILWPEASALEGRRRLSTAVYDIRKSLGDNIVVSNGDELWIPPACSLTCDVACFEEAVAQADWEKAVASYHGALIDGVHLSEAPEFEEWVSLQRERLRRMHVNAVEQVLATRNDAGHCAGAVAAARLLLEVEPLNERIALLAATSIAANGAPAEAVRSLEQYAARVRTELGTHPHPRVRELANSFRISSTDAARLPDSASSEPRFVDPRFVGLHSVEPKSDVELVASRAPHNRAPHNRASHNGAPHNGAPHNEAPHNGAPHNGASHNGASYMLNNATTPAALHSVPVAAHAAPHRWKLVAQASAAVAVLALVVGNLASRAQSPQRASSNVVVEPLTVAGDSVATPLRTRIAEQLGSALNGSGAFDVDEPISQVNRARISHVVTGQIVGRQHRWHINVMLHSGRAGASVSAAECDVADDSVERAVNELTRNLVAGALENEAHHLAAVAARTASSIPALNAFLIGDRHYRHGQFAAAQSSFETAIASDSAFALAHYRLSETLLWEGKPASLATMHDSLANIYSTSLPAEERTVLNAYFAWRTGDAVRAESLYRTVVARNPRNAEAWYQLGETLFHYNPLRGRPASDAYEVFNWVVSLDSSDWGAHWHLALLDAGRLKQREVRARMNRLLDGHSEGYVAHEMQLFAASVDDGELAARADSANTMVLYDAAWRRAIYRHDLMGAEVLLRKMTNGYRAALEQHKGEYLAAGLLLAEGRVHNALSLLTVAHPTLEDNEALIILVYATLAEHLNVGAANADSLRDVISRWEQGNNVYAPHSQSLDMITAYLLGLLAVERGDHRSALRDAAALAGMKDVWRDPRTLAEVIRAYAAFHEGNCNATLTHLDRSTSPIWLGTVASAVLASQGFERFLRAECLQKMGRHREAIAWYSSLEENSLYDLSFLGLALRGQAAAYRALGDTLAAAPVEARLAALRINADHR